MLSSKKAAGPGSKYKGFRPAFFISLCAFCFLAISCAQEKTPSQKSPAGAEPRAANPPSVTQIDDSKIKQLLKPDRKPLLINFWATWCGPCREEFPDLVKIDAEYRGKIGFFTVSLDFVEELNTGVPNFLGEIKAEMPTYLLISADENTFISTISNEWSGALPFTILYNEKGEIIYLREGKVDYETLRGEIEKSLGAKMVGTSRVELLTPTVSR